MTEYAGLSLLEVKDSFRKMEQFRSDRKIKSDPQTKKFQLRVLHKLHCMEQTVNQAMIGL